MKISGQEFSKVVEIANQMVWKTPAYLDVLAPRTDGQEYPVLGFLYACYKQGATFCIWRPE